MPGRVGELARVAVLTRHMPRLRGLWATLVGTVFAHRAFDVIPAALLVVWVLAAAEIPHWAVTSLVILFSIGGVLLVIALRLARHHEPDPPRQPRRGAAALDDGAPRAGSHAPAGSGRRRRSSFQLIGWLCQLFAVWLTMKAFSIDVEFAAAGLVLVLMNMACDHPALAGERRPAPGRRSQRRSSATASRTRRASRSAWGCRSSRRQSASASGSCSSGGKGSRTRLSGACRPRWKRSTKTRGRRKPRKRGGGERARAGEA